MGYLYALGRLHAACGRHREGLDAMVECERWVREINAPNPAANVAWRADAAQLAAGLGEHDRARELLADTVSRARAFGARHALGIALRASGLIEGGDPGLEFLAEAVAVLDGAGFDLKLARTLTEQGAALRRAGRRRDALEQLRRGLDLAARCGALALSGRAREELLAAGARPRRERSWGPDALTASELRVARMAGRGMTNPQIAQALFITRKTVAVHLTRIYQKLDIQSRDQLARTLGERQSARASVLPS
ncbi:MAG: helix-turn-helix transcriptional regulator [Solirubrobacteraceae bacterium]